MQIRFSAPLLAIGKPRPRVTPRGAFMPQHYREFQRELKTWAIEAFGLHLEAGKAWDVDARMRLDLAFVFSDRRRRDLDNLAGGVMDALNSLAWRDDSQIDELSVRRVYVPSGDPSIHVTIETLDDA